MFEVGKNSKELEGRWVWQRTGGEGARLYTDSCELAILLSES
jgi:hypothetical protein